MAIQIKIVSTKKEMKEFVRFGNRLYKGNAYYVPSMPSDDMITFDKKKNGAFDFSAFRRYDLASCYQLAVLRKTRRLYDG